MWKAHSSKAYLSGLAASNLEKAARLSKLIAVVKKGGVMSVSSAPWMTTIVNTSPTTAATFYTGMANTVTTTTGNTLGYGGGGGAQQNCGQMNAQQMQQVYGQMQAQQQQYAQTPYVAPAPVDHVAQVRAQGHVVLKKMQRVVHTRFLPHPMANHDVAKLITRHVDGYELPAEVGEYIMPDGSILIVDDVGNYRVEDHDAKVTYKANRTREFNPYINASDLLEAFVAAVGKHPAVDQGNVLRLPLEAFVNWLICEAAKRDGDSMEGLPKVEDALPQLAAPQKVAA